MKLADVMKELEAKGNPSSKKTYLRHGAVEPLFGVKISDLKPLQKKLKGQQALALELYDTGNTDAMYLAGLIADGSQMTAAQLNDWAAKAPWHMIAGCSVAWVAAEHPKAAAIAQKWTTAKRELTAVAGWNTLSAIVAVVPDAQLPMDDLSALLDRCVKEIHSAPDRVRYAMNNFVISCGTYLAPLAEKALKAAGKIGVVEVDMGDTACKTPDATAYIMKSRKGQPVAPKRKTSRC